jgi:hypothetical protein
MNPVFQKWLHDAIGSWGVSNGAGAGKKWCAQYFQPWEDNPDNQEDHLGKHGRRYLKSH